MSSHLKALLPLAIASSLALAVPVHAQSLLSDEHRCDMNRAALSAAPFPATDRLAPVAACQLSIQFDSGSALLEVEARRALDQAVPALIAHLDRGGRLLIEWNAAAGNDVETEALLLRRARAVAGYLEAAWGIPQRRLTLRGRISVLPDGHDRTQPFETGGVTVVLETEGSAAPMRQPWSVAPQTDHLDLDDFGGARNPLSRPVIRIWANPGPRHD